MLRKIKIFEIAGYFFSGILGTLMHFFYEWSGNNFVAGMFCPANESVWEHLKLIFFPVMLFAFAEYLILGEEAGNIVYLKYIGTIYACIFTIAVYYAYSGIIGRDYTAADIILFYISLLIPALYTCRKIRHLKYNNIVGMVLWAITGMLFVVFTFFVPDIGLFHSK